MTNPGLSLVTSVSQVIDKTLRDEVLGEFLLQAQATAVRSPAEERL